jgi:hypothetical protein
VQLKWSRDNGSELFAARLNPAKNLVFDADTPLSAGHLVEVLSHVVDLGDDTLASVGANGFVPATRAVGQLAQLAAVGLESSTDEVVFRLVHPDDPSAPVTLDARYGDLDHATLKLRRWHGLLDPRGMAGEGGASRGPHVIEDGISVELSDSGIYQPGQWWAYEARVGDDNANGPWGATPHGPERAFAPLALLEFTKADEPLQLVAWLDERYSYPSDVDADGVSFAGVRVGSASTTVQEAIEELFERPIHESTCTVTVAPGQDLQEALAQLPPDGGEFCFEAGTYDLDGPLTFRGRTNIVVHGAGPATLLRAAKSESVLVFDDCTDISVRSLRAQSGIAPTAEDASDLNGTVTFKGGGQVSVSDCVLVCPDAHANRQGYLHRTQTCVTARGGKQPLRIRLERNRLEVGNMQTGVLLLDTAHAFVAGNVLRVSGARDLATGRLVDQGIVVAGSTAGTIEILDNLLEDTVQGIHIGTAGPATGRESAEEVLVTRNVVHARVPAGHKRERHAIFVGNARSVHVKDTIATLERRGSGAATPVDAIRVQGTLGPFLAIRQTSARGFTTGVRVQPSEPVPSPRMWLVSETMALGAELGAEVPYVVQAERNYPERRKVADLSLEPLTGRRSIGTTHEIKATAKDVDGRAVHGVTIHFTVTGANKVADGAVITDTSGVATLSYTGAKVGLDTVRAYADSNGNGRQDPDELATIATVNYVDLTPRHVDLVQNVAKSLRGSTTVVTATVRNDSQEALPDARVVFTVAGANPQSPKTVLTNASGQASFSYAGPNAGTDTISAFVDINQSGQRDTGEPGASVDHVYDQPVPAKVGVLPTVGNAVVGSGVLFNATVLDAAGSPLKDIVVRFVVRGANAHSLSGTTDTRGVASFRYTGTKNGTDNILAFADTNKNTQHDADEPSARATQTFTTTTGGGFTSVPSLDGMTEAQAKEAIGAAVLEVGTITRLADPPRDSSAGYRQILIGPFVVDQRPSASTFVPKGSSVGFSLQRRWTETVYRYDYRDRGFHEP